MATLTPGGVMRGYCATGREASAAPPMSVMTTLRTVAKMGRSMKKRDSMAGGPLLFGALILARALRWGGPITRRFRFLRCARGVPRGGLGGRRPRRGQRGHGAGFRGDLRVRAHLLEPADEDPVVRLQPGDDLAQAVLLQRPRRDPAVLDL